MIFNTEYWHIKPDSVINLADILEGSIVYLNENGSPVAFYVAKHNYESGLNGTGRTLLVRKELYSTGVWNDTYATYANSTIDTWFNSTYKALLDSAVQTAMGTTKFYYVPGNGASSKQSMSRSVFALSATELISLTGWYTGMVVNFGTLLPTASLLLTLYYNGTAVGTSDYYMQWTRTPTDPATSGSKSVIKIRNNGQPDSSDCATPATYKWPGYYRPCFTLPAKSKFDPETMLFVK